MILTFVVEKIATLRHKAFTPDPNDAGNTMDSGKYLEELHLTLIPDVLTGGRGYAMIQLNNADDIGTFKPGDRVKAELTVEA